MPRVHLCACISYSSLWLLPWNKVAIFLRHSSSDSPSSILVPPVLQLTVFNCHVLTADAVTGGISSETKLRCGPACSTSASSLCSVPFSGRISWNCINYTSICLSLHSTISLTSFWTSFSICCWLWTVLQWEGSSARKVVWSRSFKLLLGCISEKEPEKLLMPL